MTLLLSASLTRFYLFIPGSQRYDHSYGFSLLYNDHLPHDYPAWQRWL